MVCLLLAAMPGAFFFLAVRPGAPSGVLAPSSDDGARTPLGAPGLTTGNKKLLGASVIATRSKDATRGSWPYY